MLAAWGCYIGFLLGFSFSFFSLFSQWINRRVCGPPLSAAIANFLFKHHFTPSNYCCSVVREVFWVSFFFQSSRKSEEIKSGVCDGGGSYENRTQLHVSDKAHCSLAASGTSQSIFSLPLLLPSFLIHCNGQHFQSCCSHFNRSLLWGIRMWRSEKIKYHLN